MNRLPLEVTFVWIEDNRFVLQGHLEMRLPKDWHWDDNNKHFLTHDRAGNNIVFVCKGEREQPDDPYLTRAIEKLPILI